MSAEGVKSARRVFEFLEYFAAVKRDVTVAEIATHYGYPSSSVSSIMRTMVQMGYLTFNASERTYLPAARLAFLVDWVATRLYDHEKVRAIMQDLSDATGETILLGVQNGIQMQYTEVVEATGPVRLLAEAGNFRGLATTAVGHALLSRHTNKYIGQLIRRINSESPSSHSQVDIVKLMTDIERTRKRGYSLSIGGVVKHSGAIAMMLPSTLGVTPLAVGISSVESVILSQEKEFVELMNETIAKRMGNADGQGERQ